MKLQITVHNPKNQPPLRELDAQIIGALLRVYYFSLQQADTLDRSNDAIVALSMLPGADPLKKRPNQIPKSREETVGAVLAFAKESWPSLEIGIEIVDG